MVSTQNSWICAWFKVGLILLSAFILPSCATQSNTNQEKSPQIDRISEAELARIMPAPVATLSLDDLVRLSKEGATPEQLIEKIKVSNSSYDLTPSQSVDLSKQGVDSKVLDYMHVSREQALRNNVADEINKREKSKRQALNDLKLAQQKQSDYHAMCGYGRYGFRPYGYGAYGSRLGRRFGGGIEFGAPIGCW